MPCYISYISVDSSAMSKCVGEGMLQGRPFGGTTTLISNELHKITQTVHCDERYAMVKVANYLFVNVYLPYKDTTDRLITEAMLYSSSVNATRNRVCSPVSIDCLRGIVDSLIPNPRSFLLMPIIVETTCSTNHSFSDWRNSMAAAIGFIAWTKPFRKDILLQSFIPILKSKNSSNNVKKTDFIYKCCRLTHRKQQKLELNLVVDVLCN